MSGLTPAHRALPRLAFGVCLASLLAAGVVRADEAAPPTTGHVDPRYPFTLEAAGIFGWLSSVNGYGASEFAMGGTLTFAFPVSEKRQVLLAVSGETGQTSTTHGLAVAGAAGYRIMTYADPWRTTLDLEGTGDYSRFTQTAIPTGQGDQKGFGLGVLVTIGVRYFIVPNLAVGAQLSVGAWLIQTHFLLDAGPVISGNW